MVSNVSIPSLGKLRQRIRSSKSSSCIYQVQPRLQTLSFKVFFFYFGQLWILISLHHEYSPFRLQRKARSDVSLAVMWLQGRGRSEPKVRCIVSLSLLCNRHNLNLSRWFLFECLACVYACVPCACSDAESRGIKFPEARVTNGCENYPLGSGNLTWVLDKSRKCS